MYEIETDAAPQSIAPYSQGIVDGDLIFLAGQSPTNPATGEIESDDIGDQTRQTIRNMEAVLSEAGVSLADIAKTTVFLTEREDFDQFNEAYQDLFDEPYPARSTIVINELVRDRMRIEIEAIATR